MGSDRILSFQFSARWSYQLPIQGVLSGTQVANFMTRIIDVSVYSRRKYTFQSPLFLFSHITTPFVMPQVSVFPACDPSSLGFFFPTFRNDVVVSYSRDLRPFDLYR